MGSGLSEGWEVRKLGEVCTIGDGNHSSKYPKKDEMTIEGIPFIRSKNMIDGKLSWSDMKYISEEKHITLKKGHLKTGDILFTNRGEIGKLAIVSSDFNNSNLNSQIAWFRCNNNINNKLLFYFLLSPMMQKHYLVEKNGAALQQFTIKQINNISFSFPPLQEQEKIVAILDEAFLAIDKAKANAELNLQNAKELFESFLQGVFENRGEGWEDKTLEEISETFGRGKSKHRPRNDKKLYGGDYPFLQTGDIRNSNHFVTSYSQTYNEVGLAQSKLWKKGTICITIAANIAETGILSFDACFPDSIIGITVNDKVANTDFVEFLLQSFKVNIQSLSKGSAQENINLATFQDKQFPFPPLKTQKQIVKKLNSIQEQTKKLESIYTQKLTDLEELKKSLLQKAFSGELL